ncbi:hypothetical protein BDQ17DRAFT_1430676 [Cyathus striatus]|nr:hypothetical protein BDQ17DRAFT_1430676 [Cyathus striatus]
MEDTTVLAAVGVGILTALYFLRLYIKALNSPLYTIPTIGYSGVLTSYITAIQHMFNSKGLVLEGYKKYGGQPFKVATLGKWVVLVSETQMVDDIRRAKDDQLSFEQAVDEKDIIFGPQLLQEPYQYHIESFRAQVTRHFTSRYADTMDEIVTALSDLIPAKENGK